MLPSTLKYLEVEIRQGRWLHGEEVGNWYPNGLENAVFKWDMKGLTKHSLIPSPLKSRLLVAKLANYLTSLFLSCQMERKVACFRLKYCIFYSVSSQLTNHECGA
jgi:hypothetical protein